MGCSKSSFKRVVYSNTDLKLSNLIPKETKKKKEKNNQIPKLAEGKK